MPRLNADLTAKPSGAERLAGIGHRFCHGRAFAFLGLSPSMPFRRGKLLRDARRGGPILVRRRHRPALLSLSRGSRRLAARILLRGRGARAYNVARMKPSPPRNSPPHRRRGPAAPEVIIQSVQPQGRKCLPSRHPPRPRRTESHVAIPLVTPSPHPGVLNRQPLKA